MVIHSFVCDAPAQSDVKQTKHVKYHQRCDKCTAEGMYTKERQMTFNDTKSARQFDVDFYLLLLPDEYRRQDCILRDLQIGMVSQLPVDYMHLTLPGLVRRDWQDGLLNSKAFPFHIRRAVKMPQEFKLHCRAIQGTVSE